MSETIFQQILAGAIPCHRVYEDAHTLAFLDVNPLSRGHTLLIPKEPAETLDRLSAASASALGRALPIVSRAVLAATGAAAFNVLQNNGSSAHQAVLHVHFHVIPRYRDGAPASVGGRGLELGWSPTALDVADGAELACAIASKV